MKTDSKEAGQMSSSQPKESKHRTLATDFPELAQYLKPGLKILDVGCGEGRISIDVANVVAPGQVLGVDRDEEELEVAARLAKEMAVGSCRFEASDAHSLGFTDDEFDLVFTNTVLHFLFDPVRALKEQKRVCKKGGLVIAAGVRDWGLSPRYPKCPNWERIQEAFLRHNADVQIECQRAGKMIAPYVDLNGGRKCVEWFAKAGLTNLKVEVKADRVQYPGASGMAPGLMDLLLLGDIVEPKMHQAALKMYEAICTKGYLKEDTLRAAQEEARSWYRDPSAFHYWGLVFVAGHA
jgi:ubiquinone/menaquinone biosynthesis C-methylase UbiE